VNSKPTKSLPTRQAQRAEPRGTYTNPQPERIEIEQFGTEHFRFRLLGYLQDCMSEVYTHANVADLAFLTEMLGCFHGELDKQTARCRLADRALHMILGVGLPSAVEWDERSCPYPNYSHPLTRIIDQRIASDASLQVGIEYDLKAWDRDLHEADGFSLTCFEYTLLKRYLLAIRRWYKGTPPRKEDALPAEEDENPEVA
jgi:hypothetical protein